MRVLGAAYVVWLLPYGAVRLMTLTNNAYGNLLQNALAFLAIVFAAIYVARLHRDIGSREGAKRAERWALAYVVVVFASFFTLVLERAADVSPQGQALLNGMCLLARVWIWAWGFVVLWRFHKLLLHLERGRCVKCGYHLTGLTEPRCPECGQSFDPARISGDEM